MTEIIKEHKEKIWFHDIGDKVWGKTYLNTVVAESETSVWTYDEEKIVLEVDNIGTLYIEDDRNWASVMNLRALELLKEAVEIAIQTKKNNE